ncbi:KTSC domain-containing protein [Armatimonas sp.]|uniref:KTSC domain-containing protein n=1 Tax=Armatimonas sp. TaxID=1872638 RepID=UPI00374D741B
MTRQHVSSSNVRSVGFDSSSQILEVEFHNGGVYHYYGVPESIYRGFMAAGSKGTYLNDRIKDRYRYRKVG